MNHENIAFISAYQMDIEALWVFVYDNGNCYSYYIPDEIRKIIKRELGF